MSNFRSPLQRLWFSNLETNTNQILIVNKEEHQLGLTADHQVTKGAWSAHPRKVVGNLRDGPQLEGTRYWYKIRGKKKVMFPGRDHEQTMLMAVPSPAQVGFTLVEGHFPLLTCYYYFSNHHLGFVSFMKPSWLFLDSPLFLYSEILQHLYTWLPQPCSLLHTLLWVCWTHVSKWILSSLRTATCKM